MFPSGISVTLKPTSNADGNTKYDWKLFFVEFVSKNEIGKLT